MASKTRRRVTTRLAILLPLLVLSALAVNPARPTRAAVACADAPLASGATARVCLPAGSWGGDVLVYAPGFAPEPGFRNLTLPGGQSLPDLITGAGLAFATSDVGLTDDTAELVEALPALLGRAPRRVLLAGASQGALVVTRLAERTPSKFAGVLALCGPIGDYRGQVDYFGDARVLFDSFFPGTLPGSPVEIPQQLRAGWEATYSPLVAAALVADPQRAAELLATAGIPIDTSTPQRAQETTVSGVLGVLYFNVFATNVARAALGGNPYDNAGRRYAGSSDDDALNAAVARFAVTDEAVLAALRASETTGVMRIPLVALHTTGDEIVPFAAAEGYLERARRAGLAGNVTFLPVERYGHCNFTADELQTAFLLLNQAIERSLRVYLPLAVGGEQ